MKNVKNSIKKETLKKGLVYVGLGLLFALAIGWIFYGLGDKKETEQVGLNSLVPQASEDELPSNKLHAYELGEGKENQLGQLSDYLSQERERLDSLAPREEPMKEVDESNNAIAQSVARYQENSRMMADFYTPHDYEREAMQEELDELRSELEALRAERIGEEEEEERQLALMEKSYQMAAKYLPSSGTQLPPNAYTPATEQHDNGNKNNIPQAEVVAETKQVVSSLVQPISDSTFIAEFAGMKERNSVFHSISNETYGKDRYKQNELVRQGLPAVVERTTTLHEGDLVALRLLTAIRVSGVTLPKGSRLFARAKIGGNRMLLSIESIEHQQQLIAVGLSAYDLDGQLGVAIPGMASVETLKEVGANVGGTMGQSFTFSSSAKDQILSEVARTSLQGASALLQKKLRTIRITLKAGHRLLLVQEK